MFNMTIPTLNNQVVESLEQYEDAISWINDTLSPPDSNLEDNLVDLNALDHEITQLLTALDIAAEDTSARLERIIDDVSRGIPRLAYDLHFMKDGASTLRNALVGVLQRSRDAVPKETNAALDNLHHLDTIKGRMEASREVLREAESWSTLEHEVTSLIVEKSYAKAADRLSEANKSMVVFQNTPEYDPRRTLMVNLQNQLEAALSTALVSAINSQDLAACRDYYSIFSTIQREPEFRNYYYASRRSSIISLWQNTPLIDCEPVITVSDNAPAYGFADFLAKFYAQFISVLNMERSSISSIFPDPSTTISQFISSTMTSLQPTVTQRLTSYSSYHGESALIHLISALRVTEEFAAGVDKIMEKIKYAASTPLSPLQPGVTSDKAKIHRRRSSRMSISLRPGQHRTSSSIMGNDKAVSDSVESMEWDQDLFQPFLDFQTDYGSLERRCLENSLFEIISNDTREKLQASDRPRLFRERAIDIFGIAENSMVRCNSFTYGYGSVGLVNALDGFFQSFFDTWTADIRTDSFGSSQIAKTSLTETDFSDLDYTAQDWANIQLSLHLLSSGRTVFDRLCSFEARLRAYLSQVAARFRLSLNDPSNFLVAATKGESQLLEQSTLNTAELHSLLTSVETDWTPRDTQFSASQRLQTQNAVHLEPLLESARKSLSVFAQACQTVTIKTILSPLQNHLSGYASSSVWISPADPTQTTSSNDLRVPTFSLSHSETIQRVAEGLLNLPRLFEVYADDDALAFSLETLPFVDPEMLQTLTEQTSDTSGQQSHRRRPSYVKPNAMDAEIVSSAWLISLGHTFLDHLTAEILPSIPSLSVAGAAQLASDLEYLSNIVRALNVEHNNLDKWKTLVSLDANDGARALSESSPGSPLDPVLERVAKLRGWR
uniref:Conserved oligomeric Golgi complex subunit 7 n=1 Tax=Psilocybe cubensis TaxID=181762 RepID=A0A8H7Y4P2_PSICU